MRRSSILAVLALALTVSPLFAQTAAVGVLSAADVDHLMPAQVFFQHQTATVQIRNSAAFRFADGGVTLAGLVDTSGYSSAQRDAYQFYLLTDTALQVGGKVLKPGAYGCGFLPGKGMVVMDLGGHEVLTAATARDSGLQRPRPLQIMPDGAKGFRLYLGRDYASVRRD